MSTVDVREFSGDTIVIHFGGQLRSVDAYTFANSLISIADTIRSINSEINPGQDIDVRLDAVGDGSFKAVIKQVKKGVARLFSGAPQNLFWILAALYIENSMEGDSTITVTKDTVTIQRGNENIIISKEVFEQYKKVKENPKVSQCVSDTFKFVERDQAIENFGLSPKLRDETPLVQIPRSDFDALIRLPNITRQGEERRRTRTHTATIIVLKPWVSAKNRKWSFEWNGVPVSAYVRDEEFLERVRSREIRFGNGDALEAEIEVYEELDEERGIWISDVTTYVVKKVLRFLPASSEETPLL